MTTTIDTTTIEGRFVGVHVLRPVVGVNLNANQDGTPKTLSYGGATRMRISSQAKKRALRDWMLTRTTTEEQAVRTNRIPGAAAEHLTTLRDVDFDDALNTILALIDSKGTKAPTFTIEAQRPTRTREGVFAPYTTPERLAALAAEHWDTLTPQRDAVAQARAEAAQKLETATTTRAKKEIILPTVSSLDLDLRRAVNTTFAPGSNKEIALSGRMLTALPDGDVDAAMSVAHAYTVDPIQTIRDEWTWKDDWQDGGFEEPTSGAGSMGETTLGSGTFYEWAALDRHQLRTNLQNTSGLTGTDLNNAATDAERLFVTGFANATPSAHSHNTGSQAPYALAVATVGEEPPLTLPVFERPITEDVTYTAACRVADYLTRAQRRHPVNGGVALWEPSLPAEVPEFPTEITVEV